VRNLANFNTTRNAIDLKATLRETAEAYPGLVDSSQIPEER
jgi:hypothetical protein